MQAKPCLIYSAVTKKYSVSSTGRIINYPSFIVETFYSRRQAHDALRKLTSLTYSEELLTYLKGKALEAEKKKRKRDRELRFDKRNLFTFIDGIKFYSTENTPDKRIFNDFSYAELMRNKNK